MRAKILNKAFLVVALVVGICGFSIQAGATSLTYSQSTGFSVAGGTLSSNDPSTPFNDIKWYQLSSVPSPPAGYYNTIFWGGSNNSGGERTFNPFGNSAYSGLRVLGEAGTISTGDWTTDGWGSWETITHVYHQNNAISTAYYTLANAIIYSELTIGTYTDPNPIPITFNETLNQAPCSGPGGMGTCPDQWTFNAFGFAPLEFFYDGNYYEVAFQLANFNNSVSDLSSFPLWTVWTAEGVTSSMDVQMAIRMVPEPTTLTLLGLGLLGIGLASRRRKKI